MKKEQVKFPNPDRPARIFSAYYEEEYTVTTHFHREIELLRVDTGTVRCFANNTEYILKKGEIIFFNSFVPHSTEIPAGAHTSFIQFKNPSLSDIELYHLSKFLKYDGVPVYVFSSTDSNGTKISEHITSIIQENKEAKKEYDYKIISHIYLILSLLHHTGLLIDPDALIDTEAVSRISPVLELINSKYTENLSLDYLSSVLNLNKNYFCRLFKKAIGATTTEYLNFIRSYHARNMLSSELSITEISNQVGFSSLSYFNRTFKKFYFCSPSVYRKISGRKDGLWN